VPHSEVDKDRGFIELDSVTEAMMRFLARRGVEITGRTSEAA
jgi:hypothetical protein